MSILVRALQLAIVMSAFSQAFADERDTRKCLRQQAWEQLGEGWSTRHLRTTALNGEEMNVVTFRIQTQPTVEYKVHACLDDPSTVSRIAVFRPENGEQTPSGEALPAFTTPQQRTKEPSLVFKTEAPEEVVVVLHLKGPVLPESTATLAVSVR